MYHSFYTHFNISITLLTFILIDVPMFIRGLCNVGVGARGEQETEVNKVTIIAGIVSQALSRKSTSSMLKCMNVLELGTFS